MGNEYTAEQLRALIEERNKQKPSPNAGAFTVREALLIERTLNYGVVLRHDLTTTGDYGRHPAAYLIKCRRWFRRLNKDILYFSKRMHPATFGEIVGETYGQALRDLEDQSEPYRRVW